MRIPLDANLGLCSVLVFYGPKSRGLEIPLHVTSGCVPCLYFMDLNESRGLDIHIYIYTYMHKVY
jgi:hypothetical protein